MIDLGAAAELLDFAKRIGPGQRAKEQLEGAVAIHNILEQERVAYLADEVGMGKTYVALGAIALFRHFNPSFRILVIAPRENIQRKWIKEMGNFVANNVKFPDLRVKALDERPVRPMIHCPNLVSLVHETMLNPNRDFFLRMTSFSLPLAGKGSVDSESVRRLRDGIRRYLPWLEDNSFDLRTKEAFKDNIAMAICCALPVFDLVVVDEGHNLKHGFGPNVSVRNRVLGVAMGRRAENIHPEHFPRFGPRARRVLFLSATPVEETYRHLWNQLDVFGLSKPYADLCRSDLDDESKKSTVGRFLVRRVTGIRIQGKEYTKNLYRREWRSGGVRMHDEPIRVEDLRQRLIVALVQKKVSELLRHERFGTQFQVGMLASFESFLETARLKRDEPEAANFDDSEQTQDPVQREGIDVADLNRLARSYRKRFGTEMPHPKMDALVEALDGAWRRGRKALVFVRRVASVKELKAKIDERYDAWLIKKLKRELPQSVLPQLKEVYKQYRSERLAALAVRAGEDADLAGSEDRDEQDIGGRDTFFAWFFRGEGPRGVISGANIQRRFIQRTSGLATFFEDNYLATLLECRPGEVEGRLAQALGVTVDALRPALRERSAQFLSRAKEPPRADVFEAVQAAAVEWLKDSDAQCREAARILWHERFKYRGGGAGTVAPPDYGNLLELRTFFTELRERPELCARLWPAPEASELEATFRERELRGELLATAARLGHGLIDFYVLTVNMLGSIESRARGSSADDASELGTDIISAYLDLLERQMKTPLELRDWGAFDELTDIARNFDLILDLNSPGARTMPLNQVAREFGQLLRQQQPVGGMSGQVNQTLVRQFRMPGYPLVLITTDLLQEGEDLHTFCSAVHHYGISWMPSSMEQRIGRIDRVRSQTEMRLAALDARPPTGEDMLQVYFPHLQDTVEVFQVEKVLDRMNVFMQLMHEGLIIPKSEVQTINTNIEFARGRRQIPRITSTLKSAFPVKPEQLRGEVSKLAVSPRDAEAIAERFGRLASDALPHVEVEWERQPDRGVLLGTARLKERIQPFSLFLRSHAERIVIRCVSPIGRIRPEDDPQEVVESASGAPMRVGAILTSEDRTYDLTVEDDVILGTEVSDRERVGLLVKRVVTEADLLEQRHLPGKDERLDTFRQQLLAEDDDGR